MIKAEYKKHWKKLGPIKVKMITENKKCKHKMGDTFYFENPYKKPKKLCEALIHVLDLYTWRVALGFPSWEPDNENIYRIHCPAKKGAVFEMKKVSKRKKFNYRFAKVGV
jgi:uncharacterized repeat protein (TIGR04076 family)